MVRVAIVLFEDVTLLDAVGPYEMWAGLPGVEVVLVGVERGPVRAAGGACLVAQASLEEVAEADVVCVPGGPGQARHMGGSAVVEWVRAVDATSTWTTSVCTGSLFLAAAGLLEGRRATTHWLALEELGRWGAWPVEERVVVEGKYVTAAGVSAGIDMALVVAERLAGRRVAQLMQLATEYDPRPPWSAGSRHTAAPELVELARSRSRLLLRGR